ncbi:hypothetical protein I203_100882 [Kwoniella mangroviensis CBS 8507]|uniref:uncharacterized protein n=1 Tax=Kwoniella mangroviensis CBS 8507 TaxID=1296122 RepID=UPI00080D6B74|nr:uncharacterized protein I203_02522 [Kwoniella mangroviensis CBS 8507]OCF67866.1 hypothetical protein I203_02522 [Kwoniella mangroviensis CBS 8507]
MQYQYNAPAPQAGPSRYAPYRPPIPSQPLPNPHDQQYQPGPSQPYSPVNPSPHDGRYYPNGHDIPSPASSIYTHPSQQHTYQNPPPQASSSHTYASYHPPVPTVEAVPPPTPKVAYEAPVFQTFQARRRAKEAALRAQAGISSSFSSHPTTSSTAPPPSMYSQPQPPSQPIHPHRSPSPIPHPPPSTMAMMAQQSPSGGPPPAPPVRSRSPAPPIINTANPQSTQRALPHSQSRPLPSPRALPSFPLGTPNSTPSHSGTSSPRTPIRNDMPPPPIPVPSPIEANLERSDTVSSVKSLDRTGFSSSPVKRSLPKPPVGVNSSKSLDRGIPSSIGMGMGDGFRKNMSRKQPSVVEEGSERTLVNGLADMSMEQKQMSSATPIPPPAIPTIRTPSPSPSPSPSPNPPTVITPDSSSDNRAPAKFTPLPAINLPDSDASSIATADDEIDPRDPSQVTPKAKRMSNGPSSPGIEFSGLPMISVSSSDTADEPPHDGEISFAVPTIKFGNDASTINVPSISTAPPASTASRPQQHRIQPDGSAFLCSGCGNAIIGRIVNAMNQRWHPQCFMCAECGELLEHVSSYEWEGRAYCHLDFHDKFAHRCHHCQTPIVDPRFVTLNDPVLGQRYYHELHFFCSECGDPFLDPSKSSAPGTEKIRGGSNDGEEEEDNETSAFVIQKGHPYCEKCHLRLHKPKCKACNLPIPDLAINAMGAKWHKECFVCAQCHNGFANNLFFPKDGKAFCTSCYESIISDE